MDKKKPVRLEIEVNLFSDSKAVPLKGEPKRIEEKENFPPIDGGKVKLRRETKNRAGKPVLVLYDFSHGSGKSEDALKELARKLKNTLACGGTVENGTIILQVDVPERVKKALASLGIIAK